MKADARRHKNRKDGVSEMFSSDFGQPRRPLLAALRDWALPIAAVLVLAAALGWDSWQGYQRRMGQEYHYLESHARIADAQLSGALRAIDLVLEDIGQRRLAAPDADAGQLDRILAEYAGRLAEMRLAFITDAAGRVTHISDPRFAGFDASAREYFTAHRDAARPGGLFISLPYVSAQGVRVVAVSRALIGRDGRFAGIIGASLEPKYFESVLETVRPETTGFALLVNSQGDILHAMPDATLAGKSLKGGTAFEEHVAGNARSSRHLGMTKIGQVERVSVVRRIDDTSLLVIVSRDHAEAIAEWRGAAVSRVVMFILAAAALLYLGWLSRRQQRDLARAEQDLRELVASSPLPMLIAEGDQQRVIRFNHRFAEVIGYTLDEVPDIAHWWPLAYPEPAYREHIQGLWAQHFERAQRTNTPIDPVEAAIRCKNGEARIFKVHLNRFGGLSLIVFVDMTEIRRMEAELREREAQLRKAQEIARVGSWSLDIPANRLVWSDEACRIFDMAPGTPLTYQLFLSRVHPDDREEAILAWSAALGGAPYDFEHRIVAHGETRWVRERAEFEYNEDGRARSAIGTTHDITERKQAELKIQNLNETLEQRVRERTAELENSNRELESFSYSVSHDLRAPLRAIDGFSHVIAEDFGEALGEAGRGHLQRIRRATQKMGTLIDNLLDLAQVSRQELRREATDLSRIVGELAQEIDEAAPGRRVAWIIRPGLVEQGDPVLLKVALNNLLRNAWKFTAHADEPRIEFGRKLIDGRAAYFVRDNGAGIDMAYADKLFQPFQRLHDPKEFEGTGIGLAIVHRVIRRHGGSIRVESAPGRGATFFFTLG
jgi:PAS domain S-box-containing protein